MYTVEFYSAIKKKEPTIDIPNRHTSQMYYSMKPDSKGDMLFVSIYMTIFWKKKKKIATENRLVAAWGGGSGGAGHKGGSTKFWDVIELV